MSSKRPHIIIVGAGPGGTGAALAAAARGAQVTVIERDQVGGTCLNRGCIPTKTMLKTTTAFEAMRYAASLAIQSSGKEYICLEGLRDRTDEVVTELREQLSAQLERAGIELLYGEAVLESDGAVTVTAPDGAQQRLMPDALIVATGSDPIIVPGIDAEDKGVWTSDEALALTEVPDKMIILGGGVIGVELASVYAALGSQITIIELADQILPFVDQRVARTLTTALIEQGVTVHTKANVTAVTRNGSVIEVTLEDGEVLKAAVVLCAVGRAPRLMPGFTSEATLPYPALVIGDAAGKTMLAHYAEAQGASAARVLIDHFEQGGKDTGSLDVSDRPDVLRVPACVYTHPEIATIGLSAAQAKEQGIPTVNGIAKFSANGKALAEGEDVGFVSLVADKETKTILGAQIVGPHAVELIATVAVALEASMTATEFSEVVFAHPTVSETLRDAARIAAAK